MRQEVRCCLGPTTATIPGPGGRSLTLRSLRLEIVIGTIRQRDRASQFEGVMSAYGLDASF